MDLFNKCLARNDMVFTSRELREISARFKFGNAYDAVKIDNLSKLPELLLNNDWYLIHRGKGTYQFVQGVRVGFHDFEPIPAEHTSVRCYNPSVLNEVNTSESNILSVGVNQRIFHEFLYGDVEANPKVYNSHRTKRNLSYTLKGECIQAESLQVEIDLTFELGGRVTVFEGKNTFAGNFAVYQLFHPYLYYSSMKEEKGIPIERIDCCYFLRREEEGESVARLYLYEFGEKNPASIRLVKCAEYRLNRE